MQRMKCARSSAASGASSAVCNSAAPVTSFRRIALPAGASCTSAERRALSLLRLLVNARFSPPVILFAGGCELHFGGAAVIAIVALADQRALRHPVDHFAERAAVDADVFCQFGQSQSALLVERQQHAELPRRNVVLISQLLIEQVHAGI